MVETRRSSSTSKRPLDSPLPPSKRSKESEASSSTEEKPTPVVDPPVAPPTDDVAGESRAAGGDVEVGSADPVPTPSSKPSDLNKSPAGDVGEEEGKGEAAAKRQRGKKNDRTAWARLISEFGENPTVPIYSSEFTVGHGRHCNLCLKDQSVSKTLCKLQLIEQGGSSVIQLEILGGKGSVQINGKVHSKSASPPTIIGGDELIFGSVGRYAYIFQQLSEDTLASPGLPPPLALLEAQSAPAASRDTSARGRDTSVPAGVLSPLSTINKRFSHLPPSGGNDEDSAPGSLSGASDNGICNVDMSDLEDYNSPSLTQKEVGPGLDENMNIDDLERDTGLDIDEGADSGSNNELRPFLEMLGPSDGVDFGQTLSKLLEDSKFSKYLERERRKKDLGQPTFVSTRHQAFKETLRKTILPSSEIDVSLDAFPYYLSESTKNIMIAATYIPLKCSKLSKYASELTTVSPRILLSGPAGSEIYQETLVKALAKHFSARLLIVEGLLLPGGSTAKAADASKESSRPEKASVHAKRAAAAAYRQKKPTSSVEADITIGSAFTAHRIPKHESSTASSKKYIFKEGDRVKFIGSAASGVNLLPPSRMMPKGSVFEWCMSGRTHGLIRFSAECFSGESHCS